MFPMFGFHTRNSRGEVEHPKCRRPTLWDDYTLLGRKAPLLGVKRNTSKSGGVGNEKKSIRNPKEVGGPSGNRTQVEEENSNR